jgi:hypothetical protein
MSQVHSSKPIAYSLQRGLFVANRILPIALLLFNLTLLTHAQKPSKYTPAALCSAGSAALGLVIPAANAPAPGCSNAQQSPLGYLAFRPAAIAPESAYGTALLPPDFSTATATLTFYADATTGSATWLLGISCLNPNTSATAAPNFITTTQTAPVSTTPNGLVTATFPAVIRNGANGCAAGSLLTYSITRSPTDHLSGVVYLVGISWSGVI